MPDFERQVLFYQTPGAMETIAIIEDTDGAISLGIARAGRIDIEAERVTSRDGLIIALGRAQKARDLQGALIEKNYLRGVYAKEVKRGRKRNKQAV